MWSTICTRQPSTAALPLRHNIVLVRSLAQWMESLPKALGRAQANQSIWRPEKRNTHPALIWSSTTLSAPRSSGAESTTACAVTMSPMSSMTSAWAGPIATTSASTIPASTKTPRSARASPAPCRTKPAMPRQARSPGTSATITARPSPPPPAPAVGRSVMSTPVEQFPFEILRCAQNDKTGIVTHSPELILQLQHRHFHPRCPLHRHRRRPLRGALQNPAARAAGLGLGSLRCHSGLGHQPAGSRQLHHYPQRHRHGDLRWWPHLGHPQQFGNDHCHLLGSQRLAVYRADQSQLQVPAHSALFGDYRLQL